MAAALRIDHVGYMGQHVEEPTYKVHTPASMVNLVYGHMDPGDIAEVIEDVQKETGKKITLVSVGARTYTTEDYKVIKRYCADHGIEYVNTCG
jgi:hypothetical protein